MFVYTGHLHFFIIIIESSFWITKNMVDNNMHFGGANQVYWLRKESKTNCTETIMISCLAAIIVPFISLVDFSFDRSHNFLYYPHHRVPRQSDKLSLQPTSTHNMLCYYKWCCVQILIIYFSFRQFCFWYSQFIFAHSFKIRFNVYVFLFLL